MRRHIAAIAVLCGSVMAASASAAPFLDDFSSNTASNYAVTNGTINITGGVLTANNGGTTGTSVNVIHNNTAQLEVGEYVAVDIVTNPREVMLIVSTSQAHPNATGANGIRLAAFSTSENIRVRVYDGDNTVSHDVTHSSIANVSALYIYRDSETSFRVAYDAGSGIQELGSSLTVPNTTGVTGMYVGLQFFHNIANQTFAVDNLRIVPEPTSLAILGITGLLGLRRRRAA